MSGQVRATKKRVFGRVIKSGPTVRIGPEPLSQIAKADLPLNSLTLEFSGNYTFGGRNSRTSSGASGLFSEFHAVRNQR